jgi:hypothetical protein
MLDKEETFLNLSSIRYFFFSNRSQVQGSTFRVKDKEEVKDPKSSLKMLILPNNCQFGSKFWIGPDEADAFLVNTHPKCSSGTNAEYRILNSECRRKGFCQFYLKR